jgi:hypothetical protein
VQRVPRRVVRVAHERLDQERPHPVCNVHHAGLPEELAVMARTTDSSKEEEMRAGHGGGHGPGVKLGLPHAQRCLPGVAHVYVLVRSCVCRTADSRSQSE